MSERRDGWLICGELNPDDPYAEVLLARLAFLRAALNNGGVERIHSPILDGRKKATLQLAALREISTRELLGIFDHPRLVIYLIETWLDDVTRIVAGEGKPQPPPTDARDIELNIWEEKRQKAVVNLAVAKQEAVLARSLLTSVRKAVTAGDDANS